MNFVCRSVKGYLQVKSTQNMIEDQQTFFLLSICNEMDFDLVEMFTKVKLSNYIYTQERGRLVTIFTILLAVLDHLVIPSPFLISIWGHRADSSSVSKCCLTSFSSHVTDRFF